jgi:hypothetical protein
VTIWQAPNQHRGVRGSVSLTRAILRSIVLLGAVAVSGHGFAIPFTMLLILATMYCTIAALTRRELPSRSGITYWHEATIFLLLAGIMTVVAS